MLNAFAVLVAPIGSAVPLSKCCWGNSWRRELSSVVGQSVQRRRMEGMVPGSVSKYPVAATYHNKHNRWGGEFRQEDADEAERDALFSNRQCLSFFLYLKKEFNVSVYMVNLHVNSSFPNYYFLLNWAICWLRSPYIPILIHWLLEPNKSKKSSQINRCLCFGSILHGSKLCKQFNCITAHLRK